jgi:hypothetical protein
MMLTSCGLLLSWLLALRLLVMLPLCHWPLLRLPLLLLRVRVLDFTVITVVEMDMWRPVSTGRGKLRSLKLAVLHKVPMVLVLQDRRGVQPLQRQEFLMLLCHLTTSVTRYCWFYNSALYTYKFCYCFSVFNFEAIFRSFSRYLSMVS